MSRGKLICTVAKRQNSIRFLKTGFRLRQSLHKVLAAFVNSKSSSLESEVGLTQFSHSPVCRPVCTASWQPQSPAWWPRWCRPALVRRSEPSSCSAGSSRLCGASRRCGSPSPAWAWWSLCYPGPLGLRDDLWGRCSQTRQWTLWRDGQQPMTPCQRPLRASSSGWRSCCSRPSCRARWRHKRSIHLQGEWMEGKCWFVLVSGLLFPKQEYAAPEPTAAFVRKSRQNIQVSKMQSNFIFIIFCYHTLKKIFF